VFGLLEFNILLSNCTFAYQLHQLYAAVRSEWSEWSQWGDCTVTCGTGQRRRFRSCLSASSMSDTSPCVGVSQQTDVCNQQQCAGLLVV